MGKVESQRSVFDRLGSNPKTSKRKSIHDRLGIVQDVKNNASQHAEVESSKRLRSTIPSRMRRETNIHISCGKVLKVQPRTIVHTRVQKGENEESVGSSDDVVPPQGEEASSFHITLCDETPIEGEDAEEAPHELEEGVRAAIDELKEVDLGTPENPRPIFISTLLSNEDEEIYYGPIINLWPPTPELYPLVDMKRAILILLIAKWSFTPIVKILVGRRVHGCPKVRWRARRPKGIYAIVDRYGFQEVTMPAEYELGPFPVPLGEAELALEARVLIP
nr:uncharacterized protein LOC109175453 [Ipomoea trifida]